MKEALEVLRGDFFLSVPGFLALVHGLTGIQCRLSKWDNETSVRLDQIVGFAISHAAFLAIAWLDQTGSCNIPESTRLNASRAG